VRRVVAALLGAALAGGLAAGCVHHVGGPKQVLKPEGETVTLAPAKGLSVTGEFLALRGDKLVVLSGGRLVEVTLAADAEVTVEGYPSVKLRKREKLVLYARYPQGLGEEQWIGLLRERGQAAFDAVPGP
jgi:hypothetical protein